MKLLPTEMSNKKKLTLNVQDRKYWYKKQRKKAWKILYKNGIRHIKKNHIFENNNETCAASKLFIFENKNKKAYILCMLSWILLQQ